MIFPSKLGSLLVRPVSRNIEKQFFSIFSAKNQRVEDVVWSNQIDFIHPHKMKKLTAYRILDVTGVILDKAQEPQIPDDTLVSMYKAMVQLNSMDKILLMSQRQGRIAFYMTNTGEEAIIGSAAALKDDDLIYSQYREMGVLLWRGFTLDQFTNQCFGNHLDLGKGKQMPVHFGSPEHNFVTISSTLATQLPQAVGSAYAYKLDKKQRCVMAYFGEGAASEGDTHAAMNFAATLQVPVIFFARNNGYAISTPASEQYGGDGIAGRAVGYGISTIRVDGNDPLAVYVAVSMARDYTISTNRPAMIEAMTYRISHHSTSDDSTAYRSSEEVAAWEKLSPLIRFRKYITKKGLWNNQKEEEWQEKTVKRTVAAVNDAEKRQKPEWKEVFTDVLKEMPLNLKKQQEKLAQVLEKYKEHYPLEKFGPSS